MAGRHHTLVVIRHAKAERTAVHDHDRTLTTRGRDDAAALAPVVGEVLATAADGGSTVLVSSAARAVETWRLLGAGLPAEVHVDERVEPALYGASSDEVAGLVRGLGDDVDTAVVVGHNPGLEDAVRDLAADGAPDAMARLHEGMPTASAAVLAHEGSWSDLRSGSCRLESVAVCRA